MVGLLQLSLSNLLTTSSFSPKIWCDCLEANRTTAKTTLGLSYCSFIKTQVLLTHCLIDTR